MKNKFFIQIAFSCLPLLFSLTIHGQIRKITVTKMSGNYAVFSNALNATSRLQTTKRAMVNVSSGANLITKNFNSIDLSIVANKKMTLLYGVPVFVGLDRYNLNLYLDDQISILLDRITYWQSLSISRQREIIGYYTSRFQYSAPELLKALENINSAKPDAVVQQMVKVFQNEINRFQSISDNLYYNCPPVAFKDLAKTVKAETRFNGPVSTGFMRAANGIVNLSSVFANIPYSTIFDKPVSNTLIIYKR